MGWLSKLGKIGALAGAGLATAATGGAAAPLLGVAAKFATGAGKVGSALGAAEQGRQAGRDAETNVLQQQDQTALQRFLAAQNAQNQAASTNLQRKNFTLAAPGQRAQNSVRGDILATLQKPNSTHPRANVHDFLQGAPELSANTRSLGSAMSQQALDSQNAGDTFTGGEMLPVPQASPLPQAGKLDKFLNVGSTIGSLAGIGGELWNDWKGGQQPDQTVAGQTANENAVPPSDLAKLFKKVQFG